MCAHTREDLGIYLNRLWTRQIRMIGPKETQKICLIKVIQTAMRAQTQELSLCVCLCAYPYVLFAFPVNKYLTCLTTFCLYGNSFLQSLRARRLSLTTDLGSGTLTSVTRPQSLAGNQSPTSSYCRPRLPEIRFINQIRYKTLKGPGKCPAWLFLCTVPVWSAKNISSPSSH